MSKPLFASLTDAAADQHGLRRTALFLHGLHPQDREHLLHGVTAEQRARLMALLQELGELGIQSVDAGESLTAWQETDPTEGAIRASLAWGDELDADWLVRAEARWVGVVLANEPDVVVARVLRLNAWSWKSSVLSGLAEDRRERISELLLDPANRHREHSRLDAALLRHLRAEIERRMGAQPADEATAAPRPGRGPLNRLMVGWQRRRVDRSVA